MLVSLTAINFRMRYCALTLTAELANGDLEYRVGLVVDGDLEEYRVGPRC